MKRILLANKFYYPKGGDCVYTINLERMLKEKGHEVAVFAMQHPENLQSEWSYCFPREIDYASGTPTNYLDAFIRPLGSKEVRKKYNQLLDDFQPEIVHLNNIHTHLSPLIAEIASKRKIKVVWTLHDYKLLCPRADSLRQGKTVCEKCYNSKSNVIRFRCTKGSLLASVLAYFEALKWNREKLERYTDCFICPSAFMKSKMMQGHFSESKLQVLNNFIDINKVKRDHFKKSDYYCYVGRISPEKGIETLLKAASSLPYPLKIIGGCPPSDFLQANYKCDHIDFVGRKGWDEVKTIMGNARFSVIPSEWYENNPLSVIESLCLGTPVLGANIGGIPELIQENVNGLLFESGNAGDLKNKIVSLYNGIGSTSDYESIAEKACNYYSATTYYNALMDIYGETY